jgi:hypothetical protein
VASPHPPVRMMVESTHGRGLLKDHAG